MNNFLKNHPKIKRWLFIIVIFLIGIFLIRDFVIKKSVEITSSKILGAKVSIRSFSLSLLFQKIRIRGLTIYNPSEFPQEAFLLMPEIAVTYDLTQAMKGELHFPEITLNLKELVVVENKEGKLNVDSLKVVKEALHKGKEESTSPPPKKSSQNTNEETKDFKLRIDVLKLNVDRVIFKNLQTDPPTIQVYDVGLKNKLIKNIDSPSKLTILILFEAMKPTAIRKAGIYAATSLMGVGFLPAAVLGVVIAKDDATADIKLSLDKVYKESLKLVEEIGEIKRADEKQGTIFAKIHQCDVVIEIKKKDSRTTSINVKARKYLLAKPEIAAGILYQLKERLQ